MMRLKELNRWVRALAQPVTYIGVLTLVVTVVALVHLTNQQRKADYEDAVRLGNNLSLMLERHVVATIKDTDNTLLFLRAMYQDDPAKFKLGRWVHDASFRNNITFQVGYAGADGFLQSTSFGKLKKPLYVGDREPFRVHVNATRDELYIDKPFRLRTSGKWSIQLTRRITKPDGTFGGVIAASLDPRQFIPSGLDLRHDGVATVVGFDKAIRIRFSNGKIDERFFGKSFGRMDALNRARQDSSGYFWNDPAHGSDHVERLIHYRVVEGFPLVVLIGQAKQAITNDTSHVLNVYYGIGGLLTVSILIAIAFGAVRERNLIEARAETKQAQEALQQSEERYRLVEDAVNNGIWDRNLLTDEVYYSSRWKKIFGYTDDDLSNQPSFFSHLIHPDDRAAVSEARHAHLEEGKPYSIEYRIRCKSGDYCWVHSRAKTVRDATGRPVRMIGSLIDISERRREKSELEESNASLARAEELARLGHYKYNYELNTYFWSKGVYRIMGQSPDTFKPALNSVLDLVHADDRSILEQYRNDVRAGRENHPVTVRVIGNTGKTAYVELWSIPVRASDGRVTEVFGTIQDVTERKLAQAVIEEANRNLASSEAMARLGYIKFEQKTGEYTWSEGVYNIMGKIRGIFLPTPESMLELIHPDDRPVLKQYRQDVMAGLASPRTTLRAIKESGEVIYLEFWSTPLRDSNSAITGMFQTLQDVTRRKQILEALERVHQELAEKQYALDQAVTVSIADEKGSIIYVNDKLCQISGYSREEMLGKTHRLLNSGTHSKEFFQDLYQTIKTGHVWRGEVCNKRKDGVLYWVDTTIVPQLAPDGKPVAYMAIRVDISARKLAEEKITYMASHDALTGLGNRAVLGEKLDEALARARRQHEKFAVLLLDLDGFKHVNDTLGHAAGDMLLRELAVRLQSALRETDFLARLGGDEFAIIQNSKKNEHESAVALAIRLLEIVATPFSIAGQDIAIGVSIGIVIAPEGATDSGDLLQKADLALYCVKSEGRNAFRFYDGEMSKGAADRLQLLNDMRAGLARNEFELHYQAVLDAKTRRPCGAEALVRWRHPVEGLVLPDRFIPLAEEAGLIEPLGAWVLERACKDAVSWPDDIKLSVNLSGMQFRSGKLFDVILCALVESGLPPERLELEITESALLQDVESNKIVIQQLKNIGVSIALDDFGTGYSSLNYLTMFPFDKIKIDKSFTQGLTNRADCAAVISSVLALARGLDMIVTAEGVETKQQFELLRMAGVQQIQGHLFSRSCPVNELNFSALEQKGQAVAAA